MKKIISLLICGRGVEHRCCTENNDVFHHCIRALDFSESNSFEACLADSGGICLYG